MPRQTLDGEQQIHVRDLPLPVEVVKAVIETVTTCRQVRDDETLEHGRRDHIREIRLHHIGSAGRKDLRPAARTPAARPNDGIEFIVVAQPELGDDAGQPVHFFRAVV